MCSNYQATVNAERLKRYFGVQHTADHLPPEVWPLGVAPFIRLAEDGSGHAVCDDGLFGLLPHFQAEMAAGRKTYNARTETVAELPSFRESWRRGWRCIIPAEWIYEPRWDSGKAVRWSVQHADGSPMGIAGIYRAWTAPDGQRLFTFAMLTVNAEGHPVMQHFHKPGDEKRMVVILRPEDFGAWLSCPVREAPRFFQRWEGPLEMLPAPLPPRAPRSSSVATARPRAAVPAASNLELF